MLINNLFLNPFYSIKKFFLKNTKFLTNRLWKELSLVIRLDLMLVLKNIGMISKFRIFSGISQIKIIFTIKRNLKYINGSTCFF